MFQPQPTPFSPFSSSYGLNSPHSAFPGFQPSPGVLDNSGPTTFRDPIFSPIVANNINSHHSQLPYHHNNDPHVAQPYRMDNEIEKQEEAARNFQAALEGPLVGDKKSSHAITEEYAKADPVYIAKTAALPQKYSHYRPVLGDGNCGWRAAGFAYFETFLRLGDKGKLEMEIARITSLNNLLQTAGDYKEWLYEDMVEEVIKLLRALADLLPQSIPQAEATLIDRFNNPEVSNSIVYYFRLLATSWLKANPASYEPFIPDGMGIDGYAKNWIEPVNNEIDHLGMTLLIDALIKPLNFAVEIVYLDRSQGAQANSHIYQSEDANRVPIDPSGPMIHLLYRPGHYDILYKDQGPPAQLPQRTDIQVHRATSLSHQHSIQATPGGMGDMLPMDMSLFACIPGISFQQPSHHGFPSQYQSAPIEQAYTPSTMTASMSPVSPGASSASTSSNTLPAAFAPSPTSLTPPAITTHPSFPPPATQLPIHTNLPPTHRHSVSSHTSMSSHPLSAEISSPSSASSFRPSKYEWEAAAEWGEGPVIFQTSTFKNSHYNVAHYNNPNFQPEEWTPESEEPPTVRKKSS